MDSATGSDPLAADRLETYEYFALERATWPDSAVSEAREILAGRAEYFRGWVSERNGRRYRTTGRHYERGVWDGKEAIALLAVHEAGQGGAGGLTVAEAKDRIHITLGALEIDVDGRGRGTIRHAGRPLPLTGFLLEMPRPGEPVRLTLHTLGDLLTGGRDAGDRNG